ncbi:hypothetical protein GCM10012320_04630 [Sinomonas cellulolyticus]|jgi:hypothetical protein|uniref:Lmo0937 family membrane protein n=1 Tax=Sinomonas cellulolyticus TaxID=2801916 RepID=A0ABS1K292_9MICC|nr:MULTISPECIES: hypothetical protein [Sinomonas]MBL0705795.1 hypothetical protein [Sinomonas cellulolyticus]GHG42063.1 hypothetical protein GCM10012320_04630 [Sinomonas sp. KCTC 49339]
MLWIALVLFIIWILGVLVNIGVGVHMFLIAAIGFFIVGAMGRAAHGLADEAEHKTRVRGARLSRGERRRGEITR